MSEEKRIYVVVAETVDTPNGVVVQPCGRAIAQACHAIGKMEVNSRIYAARTQRNSGSRIGFDLEDFPFHEYTTIILAARDSKELAHVDLLLMRAGIERYSFTDTNALVYGEDTFVKTAIATAPIDLRSTIGVLDYLPLWSHSHDT